MIEVSCPCGWTSGVPDHRAGKRFACPRCKTMLNVPAFVPAPDTVAAELASLRQALKVRTRLGAAGIILALALPYASNLRPGGGSASVPRYDVSRNVITRSLSIIDDHGRNRVTIGTSDREQPSVSLHDGNGATRLALYLSDEEAALALYGKDVPRAGVRLIKGDYPQIDMADGNGKPTLSLNGGNAAGLSLWDAKGEPRVHLSLSAPGRTSPSLIMKPNGADACIQLGVADGLKHHAFFDVFDWNGRIYPFIDIDTGRPAAVAASPFGR